LTLIFTSRDKCNNNTSSSSTKIYASLPSGVVEVLLLEEMLVFDLIRVLVGVVLDRLGVGLDLDLGLDVDALDLEDLACGDDDSFSRLLLNSSSNRDILLPCLRDAMFIN
jgi:hypothetical protein